MTLKEKVINHHEWSKSWHKTAQAFGVSKSTAQRMASGHIPKVYKVTTPHKVSLSDYPKKTLIWMLNNRVTL
jgi:hypothetical protein